MLKYGDKVVFTHPNTQEKFDGVVVDTFENPLDGFTYEIFLDDLDKYEELVKAEQYQEVYNKMWLTNDQEIEPKE